MSKTSPSLKMLPAESAAALVRLGDNLALARVRRKESQREWAGRIGVSVPTLIRMERGDPSVSMGIYATALWIMGRTQALGELADPLSDLGALESDVHNATRLRSVRTQASVEGRLSRKIKSN